MARFACPRDATRLSGHHRTGFPIEVSPTHRGLRIACTGDRTGHLWNQHAAVLRANLVVKNPQRRGSLRGRDGLHVSRVPGPVP